MPDARSLKHLDRDDPGRIFFERPWWYPLRPWPPGMRFEDVSPAELRLERLLEEAPLRVPIVPGMYGSTGATCVDQPMAERY